MALYLQVHSEETGRWIEHTRCPPRGKLHYLGSYDGDGNPEHWFYLCLENDWGAKITRSDSARPGDLEVRPDGSVKVSKEVELSMVAALRPADSHEFVYRKAPDGPPVRARFLHR